MVTNIIHTSIHTIDILVTMVTSVFPCEYIRSQVANSVGTALDSYKRLHVWVETLFEITQRVYHRIKQRHVFTLPCQSRPWFCTARSWFSGSNTSIYVIFIHMQRMKFPEILYNRQVIRFSARFSAPTL